MGPLILIGLGVIAIIGGGVWYYITVERSASDVASIVIRPAKHDVLIRFEDASFILKETEHNQFLIQVSNISDTDATRVQINFEVIGLDLKTLIDSGKLLMQKWDDIQSKDVQ